LAPVRVLVATAHEAAYVPRSGSSPRSRAIIKGTLFSVPLVLVLLVLLGNADPVIRWSIDRLSNWLPDWSSFPRLLFFAFLLTLTLGANAIARRPIAAAFPAYPSFPRRPTVGLTEQRMILLSSATLLWIFVA